MKYVIVTGGVVSGLGKGITISSIGRLLKSSGVRVSSIKIDPYLNVDAGTMSPFEHGETFVLDDGSETDLDLGNYERFLDVTLTGRHNLTSGKVYGEVLSSERRGDYLGKTVQIVPHVTDAVQRWISEVASIPVDGSNRTPDVCLIEVGGTVGDIESMVFLESLRQFQFRVGRENMFFVHVSYVPVLGGEQKTKPTQHSVKEVRSLGISPDLVVCRCPIMLVQSTREKIAQFCHVDPSHVISVHDVPNIYHVPLMLAEQGVHLTISQKLSIDTSPLDLTVWKAMANTVDSFPKKIQIAIVGKYTGLHDSYLSVSKGLIHSSIHLGLEVEIKWIEASDLEDATRVQEPEQHTSAWETIRSVSGILIPGGFGVRGVEGKVLAAKYARENKIPFLGICLGMQVMVIEYARSLLNLPDANSQEFREDAPASSKLYSADQRDDVVVFMPEISQTVKGGTMRLGSRPTTISLTIPSTGKPTLGSTVYGLGEANSEVRSSVMERHRHRYEVNPMYVNRLEEAGLFFSGKDDKGERMEIAELPGDVHPFYFGTQFHPEFKSRPNRPSPPFYAFVAASAGCYEELGRAGLMWHEYLKDLRNVSEEASSRCITDSIPLSPLGKRVRQLSETSEDLECRNEQLSPSTSSSSLSPSCIRAKREGINSNQQPRELTCRKIE